MEKHATYLAHQYPDDGDPSEEEAQYLESAESMYDDAEKACESYLKSHSMKTISNPGTEEVTSQVMSDEQKSNLSEEKRALRACKYEEANLEAVIENLHIVTSDDRSSMQTIKDAQNDVKIQLDRYRTAQRDVIVLSDDITVESETRTMKELQLKCAQANIEAGKEIDMRTLISTETKNKTGTAIELKLERMKMPTFNGQIRDYPSFKSDFERQVMPSIKSNEAAAYVLKSCLSKEPLEIVKNVDDDIHQMWVRLNDRYGRSSKITDAIMYDIKHLKAVSDNDGKRFTEFVNTIERCYRDLTRIQMGSEISNSTIVSMIEEKLPSSIKAMWCLEVSDKNSTVEDRDKFPCLLEFLLKHKRACEYGSNDLRSMKSSSAEKVNSVTINEKAKNDDTRHLSDGKSISNHENEKKPTCWIHPNALHDIESCKHFTSRNPNERMDLVNEYKACWCCLGIGHRKMNCFKYRECKVQGCKRGHHPLLHVEDHDQSAKQSHIATNSETDLSPEGSDDINTDEFKQNVASSNCNNQKGHCLLQLMKLSAGNENGTINVMWDSGATVSMITFKKTNELELHGVKTKITIVKVGGEKQVVDSRLYEVPIFDAAGEIEYFKAYGIQQISSPIDFVQTHELAKKLHVKPEEVSRPDGEIEMLIGMDYAGFHPEKEQACEHLVLMKNKFGRCLSGTHSSTTEKTQMIVQNVQVFHAVVKIDDFYSNESLGVSCQPKCGNCKCGECPIGGKQYTLQQERELAMIDRGLELKNGRWTSHYPWKRSPNDLPNNYSQALAMLKSTERRLQKNAEHADMYTKQIDDMIERKVARKLSKSEIQEHSGPVFYVSHHEVMKPDSESTPCRIVFNSSLKYNNHMLNDYWVKGPDLVNNLLGVLIRFRENLVGVAGDIRKMYHSVRISELDQHTHRFLWREMQSDRKPDEYVITAVSFGDKPAGAIASRALRKTAELNAEQYPEAANTITNNSYVDDILNSFSTTEFAESITSDIDTVLETGGFQVKRWIMSEDSNIGVMEVCSKANTEFSKVLGIVWNPSNDTFQFVIKLNFSKRHRKIREGADLMAEDVPAQIPRVLTKRAILSQVNGIYDPLGLASPFIVKAKIMMRRLNADGLGWDDPVPDNERMEWERFFTDLFKMEKIMFARSTRPVNAVGKPVLIIFSDASEDAFGACAYVRWEISNGSFESTLLVAKSRLAPMKRITIPRLELNGALLAARLRDFVSRETTMTFSKTYCIIDSEIVRAMIQKESYGFNTFVGVRIGEIQATTEKEDWYWIESAKNIADIISRGSDPCDLDEKSEWQKGPKFLKDKEEDWPIRNSYSGAELPEQIIATAIAQTETNSSIGTLIDIERFSKYKVLLRVTARVRSVFAGTPSLKNVAQIPSRESIDYAERMWILDAQLTIRSSVKSRTLERLGAKEINGVMVVGARIESWEEHTYNRKNPILLKSDCYLAKLYAQHIHDTCHLGISSVAVKVQSKF